MVRTCCNEKDREIARLSRQVEAILNDSIGMSAIRFINQKGLSEEWAKYLVSTVSKDQPHE